MPPAFINRHVVRMTHKNYPLLLKNYLNLKLQSMYMKYGRSDRTIIVKRACGKLQPDMDSVEVGKH